MKKKNIAFLLVLCILALIPLAYAEEAADEEAIFFGDFSAVNLNGDDTVTAEAFADASVTLVNFWASWCRPCIAELPDLATLSDVTHGNVQVLGVMLDSVTAPGVPAQDALEGLPLIIEQAGIAYPILEPDENLFMLSAYMQSVPTTVIVDAEGNIQDVVVGSKSAEAWLEIAETVAKRVYGDAFDIYAEAE